MKKDELAGLFLHMLLNGILTLCGIMIIENAPSLWGQSWGVFFIVVGLILTWWLGPTTGTLGRAGVATIDILTPTPAQLSWGRKKALETKISKGIGRTQEPPRAF